MISIRNERSIVSVHVFAEYIVLSNVNLHATVAVERFEAHDTFIHELYAFPLMWPKPLGQNMRDKYVFSRVSLWFGWLDDSDRLFHTILVAL